MGVGPLSVFLSIYPLLPLLVFSLASPGSHPCGAVDVSLIRCGVKSRYGMQSLACSLMMLIWWLSLVAVIALVQQLIQLNKIPHFFSYAGLHM